LGGNTITQITELLSEHDELGRILAEIPDIRKMSYVEEVKDDQKFGKPRFNPPSYLINPDLELRVTSYIDALKLFFNSRNYLIRDDFDILFDAKQLHKNKYSPLFLLENDVWNTDAVYGLYLIENMNNNIEIYYYRRNQKRLKLEYDGSEIHEFIIQDARNQIKREFCFLWDQLNKEIQIADELHRLTSVKLTGMDLNKLLKTSKFLVETNTIAACLMLGRGIEMLCRIVIRKNNRHKLAQMLKILKNNKIVSDEDYDNLDRIRIVYNNTKHTLNYEVDPDEINHLWSEFSCIVTRVMVDK
jgi:hypothetical protein